jgi:hypothetical protein
MDTRLKEHQQHIRLEYPYKSAVVAHNINLGHCIQLHHTTILSTRPKYMDCIIREATKIEFHPNNMEREHGFCLRKSWKPLICSLKDHRMPPSHDRRSWFSVGPHRSKHTALIRAQSMPSLGTHQPHPDVLASFHYLCSLIPHRMPATPSLHVDFLPNTHTYTFSPSFFLDQQNLPFSEPS